MNFTMKTYVAAHKRAVDMAEWALKNYNNHPQSLDRVRHWTRLVRLISERLDRKYQTCASQKYDEENRPRYLH